MNDALKEAIEKIVAAANENRTREPTETFRDAINNLATLEGFDRDQKRDRLAASLEYITSPCGAGFIAVCLGAEIESRANIAPHTQPILESFMRFTSKVETEEIDDELSIGLELFGQGIVAHLSRDTETIKSIQANTTIVEELERVEWFSPGPTWVLEIIRKISGTLIVLHGEQLVGAKVEYRNISNCFHLFTLLQAALAETMPGARNISSKILAIAKGEFFEKKSDEAWWHYGQPLSGKPELMTSVFGEMPPNSINLIDDQQVMLLWPPLMGSRSWDTGFFTPVLHAAPSEIELIEMLPKKDIIALRERIGLSNKDKN